MKMRIINMLFTIIIIIVSCGVQKETFNTTEITEQKDSLVHYYNADSSYFVTKVAQLILDGLPEKYYVIRSLDYDTVYEGSPKYFFLRWEDDENILLRKRTGIPDKGISNKLPSERNEINLYYLNVKNLSISLPKSKSK